MLTLSAVLEQPELGLQLLCGPPDALNRPIAGAHNSETPEPWQFLGAQWMMLTLGLQLRRNPDAQRQLIRELVATDASALGFGVGVAFKQVPRALLDEAERLQFPVFRIPYDTPYRNIVGFVNRSLLSSDYNLLQRSLSMQNYLIDALRAQQPTAALLARLGELLKSTVLLLDVDGHLAAGSTEVNHADIWAEICRHPTELHRATVAGNEMVSTPLGSAGSPGGWLVTISPTEVMPKELVLSVVRSAERLLDVVSLGRRAVAAEERVARSELLASALEDSSLRHQDLYPRLLRFGFRQTASRVAVFVGSHDKLEQFRSMLEQHFQHAQIAFLTVLRPRTLIALVDANREQISEWPVRLGLERSDIVVAVGRPVGDDVPVARSYSEAQVAFRQRTGRTRFFDDLGLTGWLINSVPAKALNDKLAEVLAPLVDKDLLLQTLSVYLNNGLSIAATAKALSLHVNTVRYRLSEVEERLQRSVREIATVVDLHLALVGRDMAPDNPDAARASH